MSGTVGRWISAQSAEKAHYDAFEGRRSWSTDHAEQYLSQHYSTNPKSLEGDSVLEVGCGLGLIHGLQGCERIGIDPLGQYLGRYLSENDAPMIEGAGESLPFPDNRFDTAFCINALDHCVSPPDVLSEIKRVLADDGRLFITLNTFDLPSFLLRRLTHIDRPHPFHFSHEELVKIVEGAGFRVKEESCRGRTVDTRSVKTIGKTAAAVYLFRLRQSTIEARSTAD